MTLTNRRTLRYLSLTLLIYLLGLHLVGAPLHRHADGISGEDGTAVITANDACLLCDWLVQSALVVADSCFVRDGFRLPELLNTGFPFQWIAAWAGFSGGSRAPPVV